jgi:hypothetical protein
MIHVFSDDEAEINEEEMGDDEDATLADDLLDEVGADDEDDTDPSLEGFGILPEPDEDDEEEDDEEKLEEDESLEDDAEEVDFDRFDDVDEM